MTTYSKHNQDRSEHKFQHHPPAVGSGRAVRARAGVRARRARLAAARDCTRQCCAAGGVGLPRHRQTPAQPTRGTGQVSFF